MYKILISFSLLSIITLYVYNDSVNKEAGKTKTETEEKALNAPFSNIKLKETKGDTSTSQNVSTQPMVKPLKHYSEKFENIPLEDVINTVMPRRNIDPIGAFTIRKNSIKELYVNDTIVLPEINEISHTGKVKKRIKNSNGSVTVITSLEGESSKYYAVMTEGKNSTFVTIFSPEGNYELNAIEQNGYIYSTTSIDDAMIDYNKRDVLIPEKQ